MPGTKGSGVSESVFPQGPGDMEFMARIMYSMEVAEIDMPHVVIAVVPGCSAASYSGPYPNALAALTVAESEHRADLAAGGTGEVRFRVAALYPADTEELREPAGAVAEPEAGAERG